MITPAEIHRASRRWRCSWLVAWTRLRCRREYWRSHVRSDDRTGAGGAEVGASRRSG
jgi:hypothetical protein